MKSLEILALSSSLFLSSVFAAPFNKRELVVVTLTENVVHTVDVTTTVYVGADATPAGDSTPTTTSTTTTSTSTSTTTTSTSTTPTSTSTTTTSTSTTSSTPVYVAPTTTPSTTSTPVATYTPPTTTSSQPAASPVTEQKTGGSSTGGQCSSDAPCKGDITHYDTEDQKPGQEPAKGACGWVNNGKVEDVIALPHEMMGFQSNGNPFCGRTVMISYGGKTASAKVVDKCMGCKGQSIDLSMHLFGQLEILDVGRSQAQWWFTS